jgi:hypothetical protein
MHFEDENLAKGTPSASSGIYDFSSPNWEKYFRETRKTVKFPRGYKEVSLLH